jgi:hypothetical protein
LFRNRIESRGILLCGGGISSSFSPFASFLWKNTPIVEGRMFDCKFSFKKNDFKCRVNSLYDVYCRETILYSDQFWHSAS